MSFLASPRFLIGLAANQLLPHQCLLCGKFFIDRGFVPHVGLGSVQSARRYATVVAGPCPTPYQTRYVDNVGEHHNRLPRSVLDLFIMRFLRR